LYLIFCFDESLNPAGRQVGKGTRISYQTRPQCRFYSFVKIPWLVNPVRTPADVNFSCGQPAVCQVATGPNNKRAPFQEPLRIGRKKTLIIDL
jgi:hypothetical protein